MSKVHGKTTFISVNGVDISAHVSNTEWTRKVDSHDVTTYGNNSRRKGGGLKDGGAKFDGVYDSAAGSGPRAVLRPLVDAAMPVPVAVVYRPEGTGGGRPQDTVQALCLTFVESDPVADYIKWTAEFEFDGDVTTVTQ